MDLSSTPIIYDTYSSNKLPKIEFLEKDYFPQLKKGLEDVDSPLYGDGNLAMKHPSQWDNLSTTKLFTNDTSLVPKFCIDSSKEVNIYDFPYEGSVISTSLRKILSKYKNYFSTINTSTITRGCQLSSASENIVKSMMATFKQAQQQTIIAELSNKGYFEKRTEVQIQHEIRLRQLQFPQDKIFLLESDGVTNYISGMHGNTPTYMYAHRIMMPTIIRSWQEGPDKISNFHSGVVAQSQVRSNYKPFLINIPVRIPRMWRLTTCVYFKYALKVEQKSNIVHKDENKIRFRQFNNGD